MEFLMSENPRRRKHRRKAGRGGRKIVRRRRRKAVVAAAPKRRRRKAGFGTRRHRRAYTAAVAHPAMHRTRRGGYRRTAASRRRYPKVHLSNPRRRRTYRRNPSFLGGFDLMSTVKTLGGVMVVNVASTELLKLLPVATITTDATLTKVINSGVKLGVALGVRKYGSRFIGQKSADDLVSFVTILVAIDLVKTLAGTNTSITQYLGSGFGAIMPNRALPMRGSMREIAPNYGLTSSDNVNALANQGY